MQSSHMLARPTDFLLELVVIELDAVDIGAPACTRFRIVHGVLDLRIGCAIEPGHLGVVEGAVPALADRRLPRNSYWPVPTVSRAFTLDAP